MKQNDSGDHRDEFLRQLAKLPDGHAWFWAPTMDDLFTLVHVRMRETFDSSKTPKIGERPLQPTAVAAVDLETLKGAVQETLEEAAANDPKALRKRIAELEREVEAVQADDRFATEDAQVSERALQDARVSGWSDAACRANREIERGREAIAAMASTLVEIRKLASAHETHPYLELIEDAGGEANERERFGGVLRPRQDQFDAAIAEIRERPQPRPRTAADSNGHLPIGHQKILDALASLEGVGIRTPTRAIVGAASKFSYRGGTFQKYVGALSSAGLVYYPGDNLVALTDQGRSKARLPDRILTRRQLHENILSFFELGPRTLLQHLMERYPDAITRKELGDRCGYASSGGTFQKYVGKLSSFGAAEYLPHSWPSWLRRTSSVGIARAGNSSSNFRRSRGTRRG